MHLHPVLIYIHATPFSRFDAVIHFAGLKAVGESVQKPLLYYDHNVVGTINLLEVMAAHGCKKVLPYLYLWGTLRDYLFMYKCITMLNWYLLRSKIFLSAFNTSILYQINICQLFARSFNISVFFFHKNVYALALFFVFESTVITKLIF
jgi:hypothetical protein